MALADFLQLEPSQFSIMVRLERQRRRERDLMVAQLTAWVANTGFCRAKEPLNAEDFMLLPPVEDRTQPAAREELDDDMQQQIADSFRRLFADHNASLQR